MKTTKLLSRVQGRRTAAKVSGLASAIAAAMLALPAQAGTTIEVGSTSISIGAGPVDVLDAIAQFEFSPAFNLWIGRMLTPADRIEMNGPFYGLTWNQYTQPLYASDQGGAAGTYGRDDGMTIWGTSGKFQYAIGAFDGIEGYGNTGDDLLFAGRFAYNFLNMEDNPAYYTSSTYYGGLGNIFTVGLSFQSQDGGTGSALYSGDFSGYTVDVLSETVLSGGNPATPASVASSPMCATCRTTPLMPMTATSWKSV